ncbi:hypothetical protein HNR46_001813 [Haloferula luteola]|uniref:DUF4336 domain-containing protein n=1 Tax=Haloferula luteola TaxID=595692 RepID=A0A840V3F5_9BACT|nr:hypothetical protein [Haloferula luteola]MBB5351576.1 hypothetical protein [Haloferula luteola]
MDEILPHLWHQHFRFSVLGVDIGRNVTAIRLSDGDVLVHSTAPFTSTQVAEIRALGPVRWLTDPMIDHDTYSREGIAALPEAEYLAPPGLGKDWEAPPRPLLPAPLAWEGELEVLPLEGAPGFSEHVFYHHQSRALIVCDLLMNFSPRRPIWQRWLLGAFLIPALNPGVSRRLKGAITDPAAFKHSLRRIMDWDFQAILVGHGEPLLQDAKSRAAAAFRSAGWL